MELIVGVRHPFRDSMTVITLMTGRHALGRFDERVLSGIGVMAAIVDAGTFAAAGEQLGMSQPGVGRAIARLESRLGIRLFDRTTRTVSLTEDGRRFYEQVAPLMMSLEEAATTAAGGALSRALAACG